jgi:uncharacterized membrane protein HdeD (DUF308 family)
VRGPGRNWRGQWLSVVGYSALPAQEKALRKPCGHTSEPRPLHANPTMTNQDAQTPPEQPPVPEADPQTIAALERLAPRARQVLVTGVTLIVLGTAALTIMAVSTVVSIVPIGIVLILGAVFEMGVGHHAQGGPDGPVNAWHKAGSMLAFTGLVAALAPVLPSIVFTTLAGLALMAAGWIRLRATSFTPLRQKSAIVPVAASVSILIGVLLVTRWSGDNLVAAGNLLALELVATGWGFVGLGLTLSRLSRN